MLDNLKGLPQSEQLDIPALCRLFENTTNSYKCIFFLSLLDILKRRLFDVSLPIDIKEITTEMLANAWHSYAHFKLSYGLQDKITKKLRIYSGETLKSDNISLDHYLPWSFVAHNQLWNLIPTIPAVNSAKSNNLPSDKYFDRFVTIQHLGLTISHKQMTENQWDKYIESYISDLKIFNKNNLLVFEITKRAYEATLKPLTSLATCQGFMTHWSYNY